MQFPFPARYNPHVEDEKAGDFWFVAASDGVEFAGLGFMCPCGCGELGVVLFEKRDNHASWTWDGNKEKPTLTPSIQRNTPCRWHGWLTNGTWTL